jgi:hypothetical protein
MILRVSRLMQCPYLLMIESDERGLLELRKWNAVGKDGRGREML